MRHIEISGASHGLGAALAQGFAAPGTRLFLTSRSAEALAKVAQFCRDAGVKVEILAYDIRDPASLAPALLAFDDTAPADLIIARSGAVTCSEFRALGRYALFVPLPIGNGEQFVNAASLVADGRAEVINPKEFTAEFIATHIDRLLKSASQAPVAGDDQDLDAAQKIVALTEFAIKS